MKSNYRGFGVVLFASVVAFASALGACGGEPSQSSSSQTASASTIIQASAATRAQTGITHYDFRADGHGTALDDKGAVVASFDAAVVDGHHKFTIQANGETVVLDYTLTRGAAGETVISGTVNGDKSFTMSVSRDGKLLSGAPIALSSTMSKLVTASAADFSQDSAAHGKLACLAGGFLIGFGIATADPLAVAGGVWALDSCE